MIDLPVLKPERLYQKISSLLIGQIQAGQFRSGESLPSERDLAKQLGVSRASVRKALIVMEFFGWITVRSGNGAFVNDAPPPGGKFGGGWCSAGDQHGQQHPL
jgi:GntR family uxuAB operon transcriptional repressor